MSWMHTQIRVEITQDERETFLTGNAMPKDTQESYIWFSIDNAGLGTAYLYRNELQVAASMARAAGLEDFAIRLEDEDGSHVP